MWVSQVPNTPTWRICNPLVDNSDCTSRNCFSKFRHHKKSTFSVKLKLLQNSQQYLRKNFIFVFKKNTKFDLLLLSGHHEPQFREVWNQKKFLNQTFFFYLQNEHFRENWKRRLLQWTVSKMNGWDDNFKKWVFDKRLVRP